MSFNWSTIDYCDSDVQVVEANTLTPNFANATTFKGTFYNSLASSADGYIHTCVVNNLKLNTKYFYRVGDAEFGAWSEVGSFVTESGNADKFSFIHLSDPQADDQKHYEIYKNLLQTAVTTNVDTRFVVNTGDIVNNNWAGYNPNLDQWKWSLTDTFSVMKDYPLMATAGNHEAADYDFSTRFNYDVPTGADKTTGVYYSFDYNNVHFVALNTNDTTNPKDQALATGLSDEQMQWLKADLEANKNAQWIVVMMHKAIYGCGSGANNTDGDNHDITKIREQLAPLFTQYGVDLVLQGHDHLYSKSHPLAVTTDGASLTEKATVTTPTKYDYNGESNDFYFDPNGTIYINSNTASGWKTFAVVDHNTELIDRADKGELMYSSITVDGDVMLVTTYRVNSSFQSIPYYTFGIAKGITPPTVVEPPVDDSPQTPTDTPNPTPNNNLVIWLASGGSALVLGCIAVTIVLVTKKRKNTNAKTDITAQDGIKTENAIDTEEAQ